MNDASTGTPFDFSEAVTPDGYLAAVRGAFGSGEAPAFDVIDRLVPPMASLQLAQIEVTTFCNFSCSQCSRTKAIARNEWNNVHIPIDRARAVIEKLPRTRQISLQGVGEPSMHPNFPELIRMASESGKFDSIHFNTNAHTHDDAYWKELARYPGLTVALSVDSLDPVIAERCRSGTDVDLLWSRLQLFRDTFQWFIVALVASRMNLSDIESTLRRIAALGNVPVQITRMMSEDASLVLHPEDEAFLVDRLAAVRADYPDTSIYFNPMNTGAVGKEKRCVSPFLNPYIRADGFLTPCCAAISSEHYQNTRADDDRDWDTLRSDPRIVKWVSDFVEGDPPVCQGCSLNPARKSLQKVRI